MNIRMILLVVAAIFVAGLTAILARNFLLQSQTDAPIQAASQETTRVLVASQNLPMGRILEFGDLSWQDWPENNMNSNYLLEETTTIEELVGKVVRYGVTAGEPVTELRVVGPGERGFLAAVVAPGMRAVTVSVDRQTGLAGFVFPGDRVDLILTHTLKVEKIDPNDKSKEEHQASTTVLQNVRVLAVDTRTDDLEKTPELGKSVTIEVNPEMAERVAVAQSMGQVSLSLRSVTHNNRNAGLAPEDGPRALTSSFTWDFNVSQLVNPVGGRQDSGMITVARGDQVVTMAGGVPLNASDSPFLNEEEVD